MSEFKRNASPEELNAQINQYCRNILSSTEPRNVAVTAVGHIDEHGNVGAEAIMGGPPLLIAQMIVQLQRALISRAPPLAALLLAGLMGSMQNTRDAPQSDQPDPEANVPKDFAVSPELQAMLDKLSTGSKN